MLKRTTNPSIIFDDAIEAVIVSRIKILNIEILSRYPRENKKVSLHIYGTIESVELLLNWIDKELAQEVEAEF